MFSNVLSARRMAPVMFFFIVIAFSLFFSGCSDDGPEPAPFIMKGIVIDGATGDPVSNHKVYLVTSPIILTSWKFETHDQQLQPANTPRYAVDSTITSATGMFTLTAPPNTPEIHFLRGYYAALGNRDNIFCYSKKLRQTASGIDSLFTEPTLWLKLRMQKTTAAHPTDTLMQRYLTYLPGGATNRIYMMAQAGISGHTVEIPYSQHFASKADVEWKYKGNLPEKTGSASIALNPTSETTFTIDY